MRWDVEQVVRCDVRVWYTVEAESFTQALVKVANVDCPTCADGRDFEVISDNSVVSTKVTERT
jgi:hypothetical protein